MYRYRAFKPSKIRGKATPQGETIEDKVSRLLSNKEPISDTAPKIFTERSQGVLPATNVRTDRFEIAVDAMDAVTKSHIAKRQENIDNFTKKLDEQNAKGKSIEGTDSKSEPPKA